MYEGTRRGLERLLTSGHARREEVIVAAAIYPTQPEFCRLGFGEVVDAVGVS
jgi:hypothetical protein